MSLKLSVIATSVAALLAISSVATQATLASVAPPSTIQNATSGLKSVERDYALSEQAQNARMKAIYQGQLAPFTTRAALKLLSPDELKELLTSAYLVVFHTDEKRFADDALRVLHELAVRSEASNADYESVSRAFVMVRAIPEARKVAEKGHLPLDGLSDIQMGPATGRSLVAVDENTQLLQRRPFSIDQHGIQLVVVSNPECHFTANAVKDIDNNAELKQAMAHGSVWIVPPSGTLQIPQLKDWNARHPAERMQMMYAPQDWPELDSMATPTFYVFKDGKLQKKIVGWWGAKSEAELLQAFKN